MGEERSSYSQRDQSTVRGAAVTGETLGETVEGGAKEQKVTRPALSLST